ncbi:hypothetical protein CDL15_Pgr019021 [Punica granatum]|nr:hypothetical protein CDL15_Pgr019021 [Punica granatum]
MSFEALERLINGSSQPLKFLDIQSECHYVLQGLWLVRSDYIRTTGYFFPPQNSSEACWDSYQRVINSAINDFDVRSTCGFKTSLISETCMNISTRSDFERLVPESKLNDVSSSCNQSLEDDSSCKSCMNSLDSIQGPWSSLQGSFNGNRSDCSGYPYVYAAGVVNPFGPTDSGTYRCLFGLDFSSTAKKKHKHGQVFWGIVTGCTNGLIGALAVLWLLWACHLRRRRRRRKNTDSLPEAESGGVIHGNAFPFRFTIEEIKKATNNFSRENIIGKGGYGNVYKGTLLDGSEVALKRFKNCAAANDSVFGHEVEVIASVRHVNLVALRGYCTATLPLEGHQRIIVCDLMRNGSLYDHLFGSSSCQLLSWPARWRIALGTARGLAYLHYGVQPAIIHRDVKASNILLDETLEPRLADFGLAKFTPDGQSHLSTRVAGTLGYVSPEYALYGQLTERSDVYSFGVVLLQLLSGKNAVISVEDVETLLLADWAWSQVRDHRVLDVVDEGIPELAAPEVMEKYVLLAVLCSHPLLHARPSMDQVVKILETDSPVPSIPDRPPSLLSMINQVETYSSSSNSYSPISRPREWPMSISRSDHPILDRRDEIRGSSDQESL